MKMFTNEMKEELTNLQMKIVFDDFTNETITIQEFERYQELLHLLDESIEEQLEEDEEDCICEIPTTFTFDDWD